MLEDTGVELWKENWPKRKDNNCSNNNKK